MLDFANTKQLDPRITYTRASTATFYNGVTTAMAEQNLFTYSEQFDNAEWGKTATTVTANSTVAPNGTTTGDTVTADGTTGSKLISGSNMGTGASPATARTVSVYAKAGTNNYLQIFFGGDSTPWADFDLSTGTVGSTGSNQTASIVSVGSGWYRCILYTASTTATTCNFGIVSTSTAARAESNTLSTTVILWGAQLEQRSAVSAYTATTTQAITNYIPVLQTAASGVARFDNNPTTGESLGLLIEESRTNLMTYSSQFDNAAWGKSNSTVTANTIVAPDGTLTGDKLVENSTTSSHSIFQGAVISSGASYTISVYAKAAERTQIQFQFYDGTTNKDPIFNLIDGTKVTDGGIGTAWTSTNVGNGWWRFSFAATSAGTLGYIYMYPALGGTTGYTGNGFSGVYIWGAQMEAGAFATSYIPTVASQVTRAADAASMTGTNFSTWYNFIEGALYTEASTVFAISTSGNPIAMASIEDGTANNRLQNRFGTLVYSPRFVANGTSLLATTGVTAPINTFNKAIITYKSVNASATYSSISAGNGVIIQSISSAFSPASVNTLLIGNGNTSAPLNGTVKKVAFYPIAVTSAQLQALTS
jgi:hypothetical protein